MPRPVLEALRETAPDGRILLRCPSPARIRVERRKGERVVAGSRLGFASIDERLFVLLSPCAGVITGMRAGPTWSAFEYGQTFAELAPHAPERTESSAEPERDSGGWFSVVSPTHGTFYRRPSPDAPPYVEVGKRIASGDIVGLVEVMKCFSPIRFDPPEGASAGIVREILAADGAEVQADQPLLRVELAP